ncbi:MAG: response regulator transcription factor [Bacteroidota bacterium]|nr:response regulator transcription factor [Bacteroidota bacterium]MDP4204972.1 response regulator transcription factor [Bacteroidota bacterium]
MNKRIFLVEDDLSFGAVLKSYLELNDFEVIWVNDGIAAMDQFRAGTHDICILDVMLPHIDGFTIGQEIRKINQSIPIIFLTAKSLKADILIGYGVGADDYITKPFDTDVLLCKLKAILKRNESTGRTSESEVFKLGHYSFNFRLRRIEHNGQVQQLSPKEAELLRLLCLHKNELLTREKSLKLIWGDDDYFTSRSMDVFVTKLRKYLKDDPSVEIKNIHGSGFMLSD